MREQGGPQPSRELKLAVMDTDQAFLRVLSKRLDAAGHRYRILEGATPVEELVAMRLDALIVDLRVLGNAAWDSLDALSHEAPGLPIVVCCGPSTVAQRVRGLRMGADDWLSKPCHPEELIARVEAVVRRRSRSKTREEQPAVMVGELSINADQFQAFVGEQSLDLTRREFELLRLLAATPGRVLEREDVYERVWGYAMARGDRSVDVFVRKLRQKLEKGSPGWRYIHTHFGIGYRFSPEPVIEVAEPVRELRDGAADAPAEAPIRATSTNHAE
ncbi:MAG: response regulator transcription factor [Solirubrobacteraceae bacterium]|nr:response regulator transcription factor [Solirubrobacteraceae bacterium]